MIRIKVFPLRKIIYKLELFILFLTLIAVLLLILLFVFDRIDVIRERIEDNINSESYFTKVLEKKLFVLEYDDTENVEEINEIDIKESVIDSEIINNQVEDKTLNFEFAKFERPSTFETSVLENGRIKVGKALIKNTSKINLDLNLLKQPSEFVFRRNLNFLLYHTHTSETYEIPSDLYSDSFRTQDENYNMLMVGKTLNEYLNEKGFKCTQERIVHDFPSYNGAYKASLDTITKALSKDKYDLVFDIHRDAISSTPHYRLSTKINNEDVAKLMFVVGTNGAGAKHDNWMNNLKLAILIQNKAEEMYPGLFREITLSSARYNQHVSDGALIIEVGGTGNTIEEAKNAMKYLADVFASMCEE